MTALGKPELLQHLSMILTETRGQFSSFHAEPGSPAPVTLSLDAFRGQAQKFRAGMTDSEIEALFKLVDVDSSGCIDFIEWLDYVEPLRVRCVIDCDVFQGILGETLVFCSCAWSRWRTQGTCSF
jgi:hypothetical protein